MKQPVAIRGKIMQLLRNLSIYVSCLPEREEAALIALREPDTHVRICDFIFGQLGEVPAVPTVRPEYFSQSRRAVQVMPELEVEAPKKVHWKVREKEKRLAKEAEIAARLKRADEEASAIPMTEDLPMEGREPAMRLVASYEPKESA